MAMYHRLVLSPVIPDILAVVVLDWSDYSVGEPAAVTSQSGCIVFPDYRAGICVYCCLLNYHWLAVQERNVHLANVEN